MLCCCFLAVVVAVVVVVVAVVVSAAKFKFNSISLVTGGFPPSQLSFRLQDIAAK